ncbi:MAG: acyl carrier protein [Gammaproteobacteria bacterium]|nr:acyl carrier protein [Gammaproteobacteria bacterium]
MSVHNQVINVLNEVLQLNDQMQLLKPDSALLGAIPEFDSMAVVSVLTRLEEEYDFFIEDDEIDADTFESVATLIDFIQRKING